MLRRRGRTPAGVAPRPSCGRQRSSTNSPRAAAKWSSRSTGAYAGLKITDRLVSIADPDARPIRKGKLGKPTEFGYVAQICEVTEHTRSGARGFILPAAHAPGNPSENRLLRTDRSRARPCGDPATRSRCRRRLPDRVDDRGLPRPRAPSRSSSLGVTKPAPDAPGNAEPATGPASRDGSATSSAATASTGPASKATRGCGHGQAGRSSPTTSTPSPSEPAETLETTRPAGHPKQPDSAAPTPGAAVSVRGLYPGEVARRDRRVGTNSRHGSVDNVLPGPPA